MKKTSLLALTVLCSFFAAVNSATAQGLTFTTNTYPVGNGPNIAVADVNGDGRLDLITANYSTNTLTILTNNGVGGFGFYATLTVGQHPGSVIAVDVNRDGYVDLVSCNHLDNSLTILTNNGSGVFGYNTTLPVGYFPQYVTAVDINDDNSPDIISANWTSPGTLTVYTNIGNGVFRTNTTFTVGNDPQIVTTADINDDGYVDLITANYSGNTLTILTNSGAGVFGSNATLTVGINPQWVIAADLFGRGKPDLVCANVGTNNITIFTNNGKGIFGFNTNITVIGKPFCVVVADFNGDGKLDLVTANAGGYPTGVGNTLTVLTNNGTGFGYNTTLTVGTAPYWIAAADVNSDGKPDLIASNYKDNTVTVLMNTSVFPPPNNFPTLVIKHQGNFIKITWPSASPGWSLQENSILTRMNWLPCGFDGYPTADDGATYPISDDGTNKSLTLPSSVGNLFFRLLHP